MAPKAQMMPLHMELGQEISSSAEDQYRTLISHIQNAGAAHVVNLSLGWAVTAQTSDEQIDAAIRNVPFTSSPKPIFVVASGNNSQSCGEANLQGCNVLGLMLARNTNTQNATLVVGALTRDANNQQVLANYSTLPGALKDRFIFAPGDTGFFGNAQGTSYAAPRVSGAAALMREVHPNLNAQQISAALLRTANKDMFNDGRPFAGVDPLFGHGKLDLEKALRFAAH
jgi:subtilisin family serine protease